MYWMHNVAISDAQIGLSNAIRDKQITLVKLYKALGVDGNHPLFCIFLYPENQIKIYA